MYLGTKMGVTPGTLPDKSGMQDKGQPQDEISRYVAYFKAIEHDGEKLDKELGELMQISPEVAKTVMDRLGIEWEEENSGSDGN
jgi:hypothetical protein